MCTIYIYILYIPIERIIIIHNYLTVSTEQVNLIKIIKQNIHNMYTFELPIRT